MNLTAEIFETILLILTMAEINLRAVPEPDFILDDGDQSGGRPGNKHSPKSLRAFYVILN